MEGEELPLTDSPLLLLSRGEDFGGNESRTIIFSTLSCRRVARNLHNFNGNEVVLFITVFGQKKGEKAENELRGDYSEEDWLVSRKKLSSESPSI